MGGTRRRGDGRRRHWLLPALAVVLTATGLATTALAGSSASAPTLLVSSDPSRGEAADLSGSEVAGSVYIFLSPYDSVPTRIAWRTTP